MPLTRRSSAWPAPSGHDTAAIAAAILADEHRMLERSLREIPALTDAVVRADVDGGPSHDVTTTGATDVARDGAETKDAGRRTTAATKRSARQARRIPGVPAPRDRSRARPPLRATSRSRAMTA